MKRIFVFPGQGSQAVGMGRDLAEALPAARDVFAEVDDALSEHLSRIIFEGPEETLQLTENAQPALMAVSLAIMRALECDGKSLTSMATLVAGHSLGEYSALAAAGAISLGDTARLLRRRGEAMQRAVPVGEGAMAALIGLDFEAVHTLASKAAQGEVCTPANDNAPGQIVISGHKTAVTRAMALAREAGARMVVSLPVSAPFHCSLMQPAAEEMIEALAEATIERPLLPLVANVTARTVTSPEEIRSLLADQVTGVVRWRESIEACMEDGIEAQVEVGAGKVLTGLARRINRDLQTITLNTPLQLETFAREL